MSTNNNSFLEGLHRYLRFQATSYATSTEVLNLTLAPLPSDDNVTTVSGTLSADKCMKFSTILLTHISVVLGDIAHVIEKINMTASEMGILIAIC